MLRTCIHGGEIQCGGCGTVFDKRPGLEEPNLTVEESQLYIERSLRFNARCAGQPPTDLVRDVVEQRKVFYGQDAPVLCERTPEEMPVVISTPDFSTLTLFRMSRDG